MLYCKQPQRPPDLSEHRPWLPPIKGFLHRVLATAGWKWPLFHPKVWGPGGVRGTRTLILNQPHVDNARMGKGGNNNEFIIFNCFLMYCNKERARGRNPSGEGTVGKTHHHFPPITSPYHHHKLLIQIFIERYVFNYSLFIQIIFYHNLNLIQIFIKFLSKFLTLLINF